MMAEIIVAVVVSLLVVEFTDWCSSIAEGIVVLAARLLPSPARERYRKEWVAGLDAMPGRFTRVLVALGLLVKARGIRSALADRGQRSERQMTRGDKLGSRVADFVVGQLGSRFLLFDFSGMFMDQETYNRTLEERQAFIDAYRRWRREQRQSSPR